MNTITYNKVSITDPTLPLIFEGVQIPSGQVYKSWLDGVDDQSLIHIAETAAIYRMTRRHTLVAFHPSESKKSGLADVLLHTFIDENDREVYIVLRTEDTVVRPLAPTDECTLARFEGMDPTQTTMLYFLQVAKDQGLELAAWKTRRGILVPEKGGHAGLEWLKGFGVGHAVDDAHQLVRALVIAMRPSGLTIDGLAFHYVHRFREHLNDGTIAITYQVGRPWQGTMEYATEGEYAKGIVRPPLMIGGRVEHEMVCKDLQFGKGLTSDLGAFHILSHLPANRPSMNLQAILFAAKDPAAVLERDNNKLRHMDPMTLLSKEDRRKAAAGVPLSLLFTEQAPWKWATQLPVRGARATVYGSDLVPVGYVSFLPVTARLLKRFSIGAGSTVTLHRDPALPNASSMADYKVFHPATWAAGEETAGIVLNPLDPAWKAAGGDFDGDAAVVFIRDFPLVERVEQERDLSIGEKTPMLSVNDRPSVPATISAVALNSLASTLGPTVVAAQNLAEVGLLDTESRQFLADLAQACVSAQKHRIDTKEGKKMYWQVRTLMDQVEPEHGYLTNHLRAVRKVSGHVAKAEEWAKLLALLPDMEENAAPVTKALCERVRALNRIYEMVGLLRVGKDVEFPERLRTRAVELLHEQYTPGQLAKQSAAMERWKKAHNAARMVMGSVAEAMENGEEDSLTEAQRRVANDELVTLRVKLEWAVKKGSMSMLALVAWGPAWAAAQYVSADVWESLDVPVNELVTGVRKPTDMKLGKEYKKSVEELAPMLFLGNAGQNKPLLALDSNAVVDVRVINDTDKSQRIHVSW